MKNHFFTTPFLYLAFYFLVILTAKYSKKSINIKLVNYIFIFNLQQKILEDKIRHHTYLI